MPWLQLQSAFGLVVLVALAWALSEDRRAALSFRLIVIALSLQIGLALLLLEVPPARDALYSLNVVVDALSRARGSSCCFRWAFPGRRDRCGCSRRGSLNPPCRGPWATSLSLPSSRFPPRS